VRLRKKPYLARQRAVRFFCLGAPFLMRPKRAYDIDEDPTRCSKRFYEQRRGRRSNRDVRTQAMNCSIDSKPKNLMVAAARLHTKEAGWHVSARPVTFREVSRGAHACP
jgi:hypothetical protein